MRRCLLRVTLIGCMLALCGCSQSADDKEETREQNGDSVVTAASESDSDETIQSINVDLLGLEYGETDKFRELYMRRQSVDDAESFVGDWKRTNVVTSLSAHMEIVNQDSEGFDFKGEFFYYAHNGTISGRAYFIGPNFAVFEYSPEYVDEGEEQYIAFEKTDAGMNVFASNESGYLGLGMSVSVDGEYIIGEPVYTNEDILKDSFSDDELTQLQDMLGDCYDDYFRSVVEYGILEFRESSLADGTKCVYYEGYIPTMGGYDFELLICGNGDLYFSSAAEEAGYCTNVSGAVEFPVFE